MKVIDDLVFGTSLSARIAFAVCAPLLLLVWIVLRAVDRHKAK